MELVNNVCFILPQTFLVNLILAVHRLKIGTQRELHHSKFNVFEFNAPLADAGASFISILSTNISAFFCRHCFPGILFS